MLPLSLIVNRQFARFTPSDSSRQTLSARRLPRPCRGDAACPEHLGALYFSLRFPSNIHREHPISCKIFPAKLFRINVCFPRSSWHVSPFRINTYRTVSKQMVLTTFRMNSYEKWGEGGPVIVNHTPHDGTFRPCRKGCLSRATSVVASPDQVGTIASRPKAPTLLEGTSLSREDLCPKRLHRAEGSLFKFREAFVSRRIRTGRRKGFVAQPILAVLLRWSRDTEHGTRPLPV